MQAATLPRKRLPAAWAVLAVALALLFVLVSAVALLAWNSYQDAVERSRVRALTATQVVSTHVEWLTAASLLLMDEANHLVGDDIATVLPHAREELELHLRHMPPGVSVSIADAQGRTVLSVGNGEGASGLSEAYGLTPADLTPQRPWYVSAMVKDPGNGERVFLLAQRLERRGSLAGVAIVRIPVEVMAAVWRSLDLGPGSTVGLLRDDGWQVARHPAVDAPANLAKYVLFTDYLKTASSGVYDAVSPVDGEHRVVGYRKVPNAPLVVISSIARDVSMGRLRDQMEQLALFLLPVLLGLGALSVWVIRLLKRDERMRASLAAAVERNNLLMREIHHRTKNNLQSVASLLKLQPISEDAKSAMTARITAMSTLHEQAYRSDQYSEVNLHDYLLTLIDTIRRTSPDGITFETELDPAEVDRDLAQPLGLIVNEVVSNAVKHAFRAREGGTITVSLRMIAPDRAELAVTDDGEGFMPSGQETGMGSRLIRAFAQQLGNDYDYARGNGTRFAIRFPAKRGEGDA
ncbi:sensor histidine kinase [Aestuariivirga litoralis]|nr:histidine kinase dimerization/phosphoacceptor domain -containing protein [Aestuariivirga litoralis]